MSARDPVGQCSCWAATGFLLARHACGRRVSLPPFAFQPTNVLSSSSSFMVPGIKEDTSLLNEGFLQAKPEKPVAAPKPRSHFPTPAPVSAGHQRGVTCGDLARAVCCLCLNALLRLCSPDEQTLQISVWTPLPRGGSPCAGNHPPHEPLLHGAVSL